MSIPAKKRKHPKTRTKTTTCWKSKE